MTSKDKHQKHVALTKPELGEFGRNELAFLGAPCGVIQELARYLISHLSESFSLGYVDAEHPAERANAGQEDNETEDFGRLRMTDKQTHIRFEKFHPLSTFDRRAIFSQEDLVIINGNHFQSSSQVLIIHPGKNMEKKLDRLKDVKLIILDEKIADIPEFLEPILPAWREIPVLRLGDKQDILCWTRSWLVQRTAALHGLVLVGGESKRMRKDKGGLNYHGKSQREHVFDLLSSFCAETFISCNQQQARALGGKSPLIEDLFINLGPMGGILSAFRANPNCAWLVLACDLPYLSDKTLRYLMAHRNPSKIATAFVDPKGEFPEPLISIWEPKSYPVLLQYLSQGISCPRKVLINADVELLRAPDNKELVNVNHPEEYEAVLNDLSNQKV